MCCTGVFQLTEPTIVTVILKPMPDASGTGSMPHSFAMLKNWAAIHDITVQPPVDNDPETLRFATVLALDKIQADVMIVEILSLPFVDTCYRKPTDTLP